MLSKHDLYPKTGGNFRPEEGSLTDLDLILWLMHLCDGRLPLMKIAHDLKVDVQRLERLASMLADRSLLSLESA